MASGMASSISWALPVGAIAGTAIRLHATFLLLLAAVGIAGYVQGGAMAALDTLAFVCLLFASVVAHEFGHIFAARRYGIATHDVTVLPIGGLATLERMPEKSGEELMVALAGPLVNVAIAGALALGLAASGSLTSTDQLLHPGTGLIARLISGNLLVAGFNMIPAFPMDGGRVLRALLATRLSYGRATSAAVWIGRVLAVGLAAVGLLFNPMLVVIAVFVVVAARAEALDVALRESTRDQPVAASMITRFETLPPDLPLAKAAAALLSTGQGAFAVVDERGQLSGILSREALLAALRRHGGDAPVKAAMTPIPTVHCHAPFSTALNRLRHPRTPTLGVVDDEARLVGLMTRDNVRRMIQLHAAQRRSAERRARERRRAA
jgi:Zn-dependent protease/CBS domain-containing protein